MASIKPKYFFGFFIAACIAAAVCLYSIQVGAVTGGALFICGFIFFTENRRRLWENVTSFDLKTIKDTQRSISMQVERSAEELGALKDEIARAGLLGKRKDTNPGLDTEKIIRPRPGLPPEARVAAAIAATSGPRALRAGEAAPLPVTTGAVTYDEITAKALSDDTVKKLTRQAIQSENVEMFLQPVVRLPQRKARYYEMFARIKARPGLYLPASRYLNLTAENEVSVIDRLLLTSCLDLLRETEHLDRAAPFFINITQRTLKSALYMKKLLSFLAAHRKLAERLVFEMPQNEYLTMHASVAEIVTGLGKVGCRFSVDNVQDLNFNIPALQRQNIKYIKISAKSLLTNSKNEQAFAESLRLKRRLDGNGITVIAEKIETEKELKELLDFDIHYGQGYLFGKPDMRVAYQKKTSVTHGRR